MVRHAAASVPIPPPTGRPPAVTIFVPAYYNRDAVPHTQSCTTPVVLRYAPVTASKYRQDAGQSMPGSHPSVHLPGPGCQQGEQGRETIDTNRSTERQMMLPRWRQILGRALRLPSGRARTIYSESSTSSSINTRFETGRHAEFAQEGDGEARETGEHEEHRLRRSPEDHRRADRGHFEAEADSITTNAATVHSDDFQMLSPPSTSDLQHAIEGDKTGAKGMHPDQSHYLPSTSSINMATHD
ncbi:hypothetical protein E4U53_001115 [Claviceps sorghi]|nr:hypothetical protein E4U53_001115 [Claviceps sorghi]